MAVILKTFPIMFVVFLFVSAAIATLPPPPPDPFLTAPHQAMFPPVTTGPSRDLKKPIPESLIAFSVVAGLALFAICVGVLFCVYFKSSPPPLAATDGIVVGSCTANANTQRNGMDET
ncbi:uncharacterized protein LOC131599470 [Vicia villosa]|uniref:uncharacterized protein LOC131599470 n=1 Tax=Vicia villosa TaxID=3911 RepID=UPI00273AD3C1|nr:uncharacterized protein LOC131599470 [Vicia villosa]